MKPYSRDFLVMMAHSYEGAKDIRPHKADAKDDPDCTARDLGTLARHGIMLDIHKAWQRLFRTDEKGVHVNPENKQIEGAFLVFAQELWVEAGLDPPPARTVRNIITGF